GALQQIIDRAGEHSTADSGDREIQGDVVESENDAFLGGTRWGGRSNFRFAACGHEGRGSSEGATALLPPAVECDGAKKEISFTSFPELFHPMDVPCDERDPLFGPDFAAKGHGGSYEKTVPVFGRSRFRPHERGRRCRKAPSRREDHKH